MLSTMGIESQHEGGRGSTWPTGRAAAGVACLPQSFQDFGSCAPEALTGVSQALLVLDVSFLRPEEPVFLC